MAKKKRLSHDQKRKAKLAKRTQRAPQEVSLAYTGKKYKKDKYVPHLMATETAIYEAYVLSNRQLTDHDVVSALTSLVQKMKKGPLPALEDVAQPEQPGEGQEDFIIWNIRQHWKHLFEETERASTETLIGILRTILGSIEVWTSPRRTSRGYLNYIEGFLKRGGVSVTPVSAEGEPLDEPIDELLAIGQDWLDNDDRQAHAEFREMAEALIRQGEEDRVVEVCQQLIGEMPPPEVIAELSALSLTAQKSLKGRPRLWGPDTP
jgi:hypothetical protein